MRVSYNWIKELVEYDGTPDNLSHALTMAGLEVEGEEKLGKEIEKVVIGEVKEVNPHPNADKLSLCLVNAGDGFEELQIICGAPNVRAGQKVPVALPGAKLPGGIKIKKTKIRGVSSEGMICSAQELGIDDSLIPAEIKDGIWVLDNDATVGMDFKDYAWLNDIIFEIGLTPNRADCLSMINVAREIKALCEGNLKLPRVEVTESNVSIFDKASVEIKAPDLCSRYAARLVENVKIKPSPDWLQAKLRSYGIRSINNVVDVTNYVMLEMGQPLHAFDYDLLEGKKIIVRRADEGEIITTLDEVERKLSSDMLVIADERKPVAIAGVMGGYDTEVTEKTTNILLESAHFDPVSIRHTSRKLGLRSESSNRFEKGVDRTRAVLAVNRAAQLLEALADGKVARGIIDEYPNTVDPAKIILRVERVNFVLGTNLSQMEISKYLERLSFKVEEKNSGVFEVEVPTYRQDINREIDLIEEIARLYGYGNIETTLPQGTTVRVKRSTQEIIKEKVRYALASVGLKEAITYSFISPKDYDKINLNTDSTLRKYVRISNPLSEDQSVMRTTLIPGLLDTAAKNNNRRISDVTIFEIGKVFYPQDDKLPREGTKVGGIIMGESVHGWGWSNVPYDFYYCKGILEHLFNKLGIKANYEPISNKEFLHPGRAARILIDCKTIGYLGEVHPRVLDNYELDNRTYIFELDLDLLAMLYKAEIIYKPLPKYPGVTRDLAIVVNEEIPAAKVEEIIWSYGKPLVKSVRLFDVYRGKQIPDGHKSLAYSLLYQAEDRTLTDEEVTATHDVIQSQLEKQIGAKLR